MKHLLTLLCSLLLASLSQAFATGFSDTNGGIYVVIAGWGNDQQRSFVGGEILRFDDRLLWCPFCPTGAVELNYPDRTYGVRVKMRDPEGKEVTKTKLGKSLGSKFDQVRSYEDVVHGWSIGSVTASGSYSAGDGAFTGPFLPAPGQLFQMEKPGTYTLEVEMQLFRIVKKASRWDRELLRFSPMRIKVEKPPQKVK